MAGEENSVDIEGPRRWTVPREAIESIGGAINRVNLLLGSLDARFAAVEQASRSHGSNIERLENRVKDLEVFKAVTEARGATRDHLFTAAVAVTTAVFSVVGTWVALRGSPH